MVRSYSFFALLLLVAFLAVSVHAEDPQCQKGIKRGTTCCPTQCLTCGGRGCGARGRRVGRKGQCCIGSVKRSGRLCSQQDAPCRLTAPSRKKNNRKRNNNNNNNQNNQNDDNNNNVVNTNDDQNNQNNNDNNNVVNTNSGGGASAARQGKWTVIDSSLKAKSQARHEACFVMANGLAYLIGGRGRRKLSVFNPSTRAWTDRGNMPTQMHHMQCVAVGTKIYIVSAWFGNSPRENNHDKVFVYDTVANRWSNEPGMPEPRRRGGAASVYRPEDNRIYVAGGNRGGHGPPSQTLGYFDAYDVGLKRWFTNLPSLPEGRDHTGGAMVKGRLCVAGGRDGGKKGFFRETTASVYCFNFGSNAWDRVPNLPTPRGGVAVATTCSGDMMVAGGETGRGRAWTTAEVFDGSSWSSVDGMTTGRHGTGLAVSNCACGHIFTASGSGRRGGRPELPTTEVFVPNGKPGGCSSY